MLVFQKVLLDICPFVAEVPVVKTTDGIYMQKGKRYWETGRKS